MQSSLITRAATPTTGPEVPSNFRASGTPLPEPWEERFGPLRRGTVDGLVVVGQIGQSIDGRIATVTGHSKYINGPAGLAHLHRLRALVDAVLVGHRHGGRRRSAAHRPARAPGRARRGSCSIRAGGCPPDAKLLGRRRRPPAGHHRRGRDAAASRRRRDRARCRAPAARSRRPRSLRRSPSAALRRILIEGGAHTVSRFIAAGCLDRLHVMVAPIMLGSGQAGMTLHADRDAPTRRCARRCGRT